MQVTPPRELRERALSEYVTTTSASVYTCSSDVVSVPFDRPLTVDKD